MSLCWVQPQALQLPPQLLLLVDWLQPWEAASWHRQLAAALRLQHPQQLLQQLLRPRQQHLWLRRLRLTCWVVTTCTCPMVSASRYTSRSTQHVALSAIGMFMLSQSSRACTCLCQMCLDVVRTLRSTSARRRCVC
jgi:heme O synthase-like polyprenyltransferase